MLLAHAAAMTERWERLAEAPFAPECLTLNPGNGCNMACRYCFSADSRRDAPLTPVRMEAVAGAAALVARHCAAKGRTFQLVLHGGGEPALHWDVLQEAVAITRRAALEAGIAWRGYVATNGLLDEGRARWLAQNLDEIGLSCDGPPDVQDYLRPATSGKPASLAVERTAAVLRACGARFTIRTTITPATTERQAEIVAWLDESLGAKLVRFEPVFLAGANTSERFRPEQADWFVHHYRRAEREARARVMELEFGGVRLEEIHGPHCNPLKDVLQLLPDGSFTGCFARGRDVNDWATIGHWEAGGGEVRLDERRLSELKRAAMVIPERCRGCVNVLHCARECPEVCLAGGEALPDEPGFRCLISSKLAEGWVLEAAGFEPRSGTVVPASRIRRLLAGADEFIDTNETLALWEAVRHRFAIECRALPPPLWQMRGFEDDGAKAWRHLKMRLESGMSGEALSVYVHVPFCDRRCGFCDCYSVPLPGSRREQESAFAAALLAEMDAWTDRNGLRERPVTTIHFGGGTPHWLSAAVFERIVTGLRERLLVTPATEWAIETTTSLAGPAELKELWRLGFRRLHLGVQTLEDSVRENIGRRESAAKALSKVAAALDRGFVTTADLVFGLPGQTMTGWLSGLATLADAGLDGFSLYGLQVSHRNRRFLERRGGHGANPVWEFLLFCAADQYLTRRGLVKNHFTHFAGPRDGNLYYTHGLRGEDLLALGPSADGVFNGYHYRHPELEGYLAGPPPGLEGGLEQPGSGRAWMPAASELMCGRLSESALWAAGRGTLIGGWLEAGLLVSSPPGGWRLSATGSWFIQQMLDQLEAA